MCFFGSINIFSSQPYRTIRYLPFNIYFSCSFNCKENKYISCHFQTLDFRSRGNHTAQRAHCALQCTMCSLGILLVMLKAWYSIGVFLFPILLVHQLWSMFDEGMLRCTLQKGFESLKFNNVWTDLYSLCYCYFLSIQFPSMGTQLSEIKSMLKYYSKQAQSWKESQGKTMFQSGKQWTYNYS